MIFYHGTTNSFNLREGDYLLPTMQTGILREEWRKNNTDKVFFITSLLSATKFAKKGGCQIWRRPYNIYYRTFLSLLS